MANQFHPISLNDVDNLMAIENASHSHPWTESLFRSCVGGRYFGQYLTIEQQNANRNSTVGFYVGDYVAGEATLMNICVNPIEQGQGYGKVLLTEFISHAKRLGAEKLFLEVRASNISAQMLYINYGFSEISRRTGYYPKAIGYEDAIVMSKNL